MAEVATLLMSSNVKGYTEFERQFKLVFRLFHGRAESLTSNILSVNVG